MSNDSIEEIYEHVKTCQGMKVHANADKNEVDSNFILRLINELTLLSNQITQGAYFNAGYSLGKIQKDLVLLMEQLQEKEITRKKKEINNGLEKTDKI